MVKKGVISIGNHMNAIRLRDKWARVMFLKSKFENITSDHISQNV